MAVTFQLCDVAPPTGPLEEAPLHAALAELLGSPVEACGAARPTIVPVARNAFVTAAWLAFDRHHPLVLGPDAVWLCIAQGFAAHVQRDPESLRGRFVRHDGRAKLEVRRDDFSKGSPDNPWPEVFSAFSDQIAGHIGRQRDLVVCDFSTTGPIERAASELVLLDAMQSYFEYDVYTLCGIPAITLTGTRDDWRSVRRRTAMLAEYGLEWWTAVLLPILDEFVAAASGRPDLELWRCFFKDRGGSGGPYLHGWILLLFPYFLGEDVGAPLRRNPIVTAARGDSPIGPRGGPAPWVRDARIGPGELPLGLARAPLLWRFLGEDFVMDLIGGFVGVTQDPVTLALAPAIGWAVRDRADADVVRQTSDLHTPTTDPAHEARIDDLEVDDPPHPPATAASDDGVFLVSEAARCSRARSPNGRLILAATGLYFIPGAAPDAALAGVGAPWLGRALSDDDDEHDLSDRFAAVRGRSPADQVAAIAGALHLGPAALAGLVVSDTDLGRPDPDAPGWTIYQGPCRSTELAVRLGTGEALTFTLLDPPRDSLAAWIAALDRSAPRGG